MKLLNSINRTTTALPFFVTLTYHDAWPEDPEGRKAHLDAFQKRLERRYGQFAAIWKLEFQKRGAPHYHLLMFLEPSQIIGSGGRPPSQHRRDALMRLRNNIAWAWAEIVDPEDVQLLDAGTSVENVRSWRGVNSYAAKYMGKLESLQGDTGSIGRCWGVWRRGMLDITWATHSLTVGAAVVARRVLRRLSKQRYRNHLGDLQGVSCYMLASTSSRLLDWLGYYAQPPPETGPPVPGDGRYGRRPRPPATGPPGRWTRAVGRDPCRLPGARKGVRT